MRSTHCVLSFVICVSVAGPARAADKYEVVPVGSRITFSTKQMLLATIHGRFKEFAGNLELDETDLRNSWVELTILSSSIDTRNRTRDRHLRGRDFFDTARHPHITFRSESISRVGDDWLAIGPLTMRGVSRKIRLPFRLTGPELEGSTKRLGIRGEMELNRKHFGISWNGVLDRGGIVVSNKVKIQIDVQAVHDPDATPDEGTLQSP